MESRRCKTVARQNVWHTEGVESICDRMTKYWENDQLSRYRVGLGAVWIGDPARSVHNHSDWIYVAGEEQSQAE